MIASLIVFEGLAQKVNYGLKYESNQAIAIWLVNVGNNKCIDLRVQGKANFIFGDCEVVEDTIYFFPVVAFNPELNYEVVQENELIATFRPIPIKRPQVSLNIYPKTKIVPSNLLKMHLVFSAPMQVGKSYQHIRFYHDNELIFPLLELYPELWNESKTVLTLWLDPGRIKRNLIRNHKLGAPLLSEQEYTLIVDSIWQDQNHQPLGRYYQKTFRTFSSDRTRLTMADWDVFSPKRATKDTLILKFNEPMDYLLLRHALRVYQNGQQIVGNISSQQEESEWLFVPKYPWAKGKYRIEIEGRLEDLAGNNLNRPFDRDLNAKSEPEKEIYLIEFTVD